MRFIKSTAITVISNGLIFLISMLSAVVLSRLLGPSGRGVVDVANNFLSFAILIFGWGLSLANVYIVGREREKISEVLGNNLLLTIPTLLLMIPFYFLNEHFQFQFLRGISSEQFILVLLSIPAMNFKQGMLNIVLALQDMAEYNRINVLDRLTGLFLLAFFLWVKPSPTAAILSTLIAALGIGSWAVYRIRRRYAAKFKVDFKVIKDLLSYGVQSIIGNTIQKLNYRLDIFIVNYYLPLTAVGVYGVAVTLAETLWGLSGSIATVILPRAAASGESREMHEFTNRVTRISLTIITTISLCLALVSKPLIYLMFGADFLAAVSALLWLLPGVAIFSVSNILANYLAGAGQLIKNTYSAIVSSVVTITLDLLLIPMLGINGASIATSISYTCFTGMTLFFYTRFTQSRWQDVLLLKKEDIELIRGFIGKGLQGLNNKRR